MTIKDTDIVSVDVTPSHEPTVSVPKTASVPIPRTEEGISASAILGSEGASSEQTKHNPSNNSGILVIVGMILLIIALYLARKKKI